MIKSHLFRDVIESCIKFVSETKQEIRFMAVAGFQFHFTPDSVCVLQFDREEGFVAFDYDPDIVDNIIKFIKKKKKKCKVSKQPVDDKYYEKIGKELDKHPIGIPRMHRGA